MAKRKYSSGRTYVPPPSNPYQYTKKLRVVDISAARNAVNLFAIEILTNQGWKPFDQISGRAELSAYVERKESQGFHVDSQISG